MRTSKVDRKAIERAMRMTKSNSAAAKYLGVKVSNYKIQALRYFNEDGISLYDAHKNQNGKGVKKPGSRRDREPDLVDILEGRAPIHFLGPKRMRDRLVAEGFFEECCSRCKFNERRAMDMKIPLILNFKDFNKRNFILENLEILCYNCYYLNVGDMFEQAQIDVLEAYTESIANKRMPQFEVPEQHQKLIDKVLNLDNKKAFGTITPEEPEDYGSDLISYAQYKK